MIEKIISGGQTGADRAALDSAIRLGIPHGGWLPEGRKTEDGALPERYLLKELQGGGYQERTEQNVIDSDATVIISHGNLSGGSKLTAGFAKKHARPRLHLDMNMLSPAEAAAQLNQWAGKHAVKILNVAGPRASGDDMIYNTVTDILTLAFSSGQM